ncbi:exodeoxyribonuclease V subunit alpha [Planctobacterium marinum]|uniref:exodeoxyribonuclease V subunit alpha n=1 Tax=Planctobacterium marinum TaxID=1631968 RepID=UPI001E5E0C55|nr:exodeoxyribonuclease V subunit alpha [Planctobacterium marinum]MCC2604548.1 exodeoxyribonuclease V subunit alpha [Planctobacterium marinum]
MNNVVKPGRYSLRQHDNSSRQESALTTPLNRLLERQKIREIDRSFAIYVVQQIYGSGELHTPNDNAMLLAMTAALLSEQLGQQHVCLDLTLIQQPFLPDFIFPEAQKIKQLFTESAVQQSGLFKLAQNRLYLSRYWQYEYLIAEKLTTLAATPYSEQAVADCLQQLYSSVTEDEEINWQKTAVALACLRGVAVIAGGPGTGKTTTVVRILWSLCELSRQQGGKQPIIKMVAPTGKAAARLTESVSGAIAKLPSNSTNIPSECSTIHRLLGPMPGSVFFRHNSQHPLNVDVLVVDEASMIDMPLLAKMLAALPQHCRLILLGDSHQLASVEVGSVFSDLCSLKAGRNFYSPDALQQLSAVTRQPALLTAQQQASETVHSPFINNIVYLQKSWRFGADSGIGALAKAINSGDTSQTVNVLRSSRDDVVWQFAANHQDFIRAILPHFERLHDAVDEGAVGKAFEVLSQWQVLAVQRKGKWGVQTLNSLIHKALMKAERITVDDEFYAGRPIMITSNDYQNRLFNGDIGIVMRGDKQHEDDLLRVWFVDSEQGFRSLLPAQLPSHETLYAMTTHKSQGSEFAHVLMCLPESVAGEKGRVNRELLYTGVTRARSSFMLFCDETAVVQAVQQRCLRASGLAFALANKG